MRKRKSRIDSWVFLAWATRWILVPFAGVTESQEENQGFCFRPAKFEMCIRQPYGGVEHTT